MFFSKKPKFLIYGSKGWIGGMYIEYLTTFFKDIKITCGESRIDSPNVFVEIKKVNPTHVISFTGRTHGVSDTGEIINTIDYLQDPKTLTENIKDNLFGPLNLADICTKLGIHFTYLGTGCIFYSLNEIPFYEKDVPNFFGSNYSIVKGFTDRLLNDRKGVLNLRIRMPISSKMNDRNFITKITKYSKICSMPNSMTVLDDYFPIFTKLILKNRNGTYNCTNPGTINHNEILELYREHVDPDFKWENFSLQEQTGLLKSLRSNNELCTHKIQSEFLVKDIHQSVRDILIKYK
jgi:nucleoside-diphosphate-sugar epimerase